jgi:N-acetylmuramoyl-L-alanine amidase
MLKAMRSFFFSFMVIFLFLSSVIFADNEKEEFNKFDVIVLDPGHGGKDWGAKGSATGLKEKDVVLEVVKMLKDKLENKMGITVYLTRTGDYFVPLKDRTATANNQKADLFVSIHTNAAFREGANGFEAFILSNQASDKAAETVANSENQVIELENIPAGSKDELNSLLWSLAQNQFLEESCHLCDILQKEYCKTLNVTNRGIKQAPLYVLYGATMPAVLIEIGFLTNRIEEGKLATSDYKERIVDIIYRSVLMYRDEYYNKKMFQGNNVIPR